MYHIITLKGANHIALKAITSKDLEAMARVANDPGITAFLREMKS